MTETLHLSSREIEGLAQGTQGMPAAAPAHLAGCAQCQAKLEQVRVARERFSRDVFARTAPAVADRILRRRPALWWTWIALPTLAAAAIALLVRPRADEIGYKGDVSLRVFAARAEQVARVRDGEVLPAGEKIRFEVDPAGLPYLLLASVDGAGQVTVYVPYGGAESLAIDPNRPFASPSGFQLDAVPGPERVFAFLSRSPLPTERVTEALKQLGAHGPQAIRNTRRLPMGNAVETTFLWENGSR